EGGLVDEVERHQNMLPRPSDMKSPRKLVTSSKAPGTCSPIHPPTALPSGPPPSAAPRPAPPRPNRSPATPPPPPPPKPLKIDGNVASAEPPALSQSLVPMWFAVWSANHFCVSLPSCAML